MKEFRSTQRLSNLPVWAVMERQLIDLMNTTPEWVLNRYTHEDGSLMWPPDPKNFVSIDGLDDMYESFHNWPLFYLVGGDKKFLAYAQREYDAITRQGATLDSGHGHPMVVNEYEQGYDWMHQGEGYALFYFLNLADPKNPINRERSIRYAGFYLGEDPDAINYDQEKKLMLCCYNGSKGEASRNFDRKPWVMADWKRWYGLPFHDLEGVVTINDVNDIANAQKVADAMHERMAEGDTLVNLLSTTQVFNAYLHTGDEKYKRWICDYIDAWRKRAEENGGLVPDNVGPNGIIGEKMKDHHWYGGYYGWTWPHGFYFLAEALTVATQNEALMLGNAQGMDFVRKQYELVEEHAVVQDDTIFIPMKYSDPGTVHEYFTCGRFLTMDGKVTDDPAFSRLLEKDGWYEYKTLPPQQPVHLWLMSQEKQDMDHIMETRDKRRKNWNEVDDFYGVHKNQGGRDFAWMLYLQGQLPDYPEKILQFNMNQVYDRIRFIANDTQDPATYTDSYLQRRNPITMEGLVELTMGGPLPLYNGGHLMVSLRYFDVAEERPGLPQDVAALVESINAEGVTVHLVNLSRDQERKMLVMSGAFGEHEIISANGEAVSDKMISVTLEPLSEITLQLKLRRFANTPRYIAPFDEEVVTK